MGSSNHEQVSDVRSDIPLNLSDTAGRKETVNVPVTGDSVKVTYPLFTAGVTVIEVKMLLDPPLNFSIYWLFQLQRDRPLATTNTILKTSKTSRSRKGLIQPTFFLLFCS